MSDFRDSKIRAFPLANEKRFEQSFAALVGREPSEKVVPIVSSVENSDEQSSELGRHVGIDAIQIGPKQIRQHFDQEELEALAQSLVQQGLVQPIVVRPVTDGQYELVAGERRLRAAKLAGFTTVPVMVRELSDQEALETAIVENAQRENLNPVEEARAYERLTKEFGLSQGEIARRLGRSRVAVTNAIRLLQLPSEILELLQDGGLSAGHGRVLLMLEEPELQIDFARRVVMNGLSVRALERLVAQLSEPIEKAEILEADKAQFERLGRKVAEILELEANLRVDRQGRKKLELVFPSEASWKRFMARIRE